MRTIALIAVLLVLFISGMPAPAAASELRTVISLSPAMVVGYSKEYDQKKRELERERQQKKEEAYERGRQEDKTIGFLLGCLLGGVGIIIAYVMD